MSEIRADFLGLDIHLKIAIIRSEAIGDDVVLRAELRQGIAQVVLQSLIRETLVDIAGIVIKVGESLKVSLLNEKIDIDVDLARERLAGDIIRIKVVDLGIDEREGGLLERGEITGFEREIIIARQFVGDSYDRRDGFFFEAIRRRVGERQDDALERFFHQGFLLRLKTFLVFLGGRKRGKRG